MADSSNEMLDFFNSLSQFDNFGKEIAERMTQWGVIFLNAVVEEIVKREVIDTGALRDSFVRGGKDNIWVESDSGLTIEIGSSNEYGAAVNNGHKTCPPGVAQRWVPGEWRGNKFFYIPNAKTGMLLKQQWIDARPFFTAVERYAPDKFVKFMWNEIEEILDRIWT